MLWRLVRLDILNLLRDPTLSAAVAAFTAVFLLSGTAAWIDVRQHALTTARVAAEERHRWLGQGKKDPHSAAHYSIYTFRPSLPLQAVDPGIVPFVGQAVWLEAHLQNDLLFRPQQDATLFERLGSVDPAGLLTRFGPLAVFLLAFASTARERERGVLALALGNAPARGPYLAAKVGGIAVVSLVALVGPLVLTGALSIATATGDAADAIVRLAGWTLGAGGYVLVLSLIAVSICLAAPTVQAAFTCLLLAWVAIVLAALPAASAVAEWTRPIPSFQQMKLVLTDEAPAYWSPETGAQQIAGILQRYRATSENELTERQVNVRGAQLDIAERHAQQVFDREIGRFYDRVMAQDADYVRLGWLSPAVAFDVTSAAFAGTDFAHHRHFIDFAESYRRRLVNRMNADLIPNPAVEGQERTNDIALWSEIPAFDYTPLPVAAAWRSVASALFALTFWVAASVALAAIVTRRVRP